MEPVRARRLLLIGIALVAVVSTGVGRASGGRAVWTNTGPFDLDLTTIVSCPSDPLRVYADSIWTSVLRSDDGGQSWREAGFDELGVFTAAVAVDPLNPDAVYAGDDMGLQKSTDGGENWTAVPGNISGSGSGIQDVESILVYPGPPSILYVVAGDELFQSSDDGMTFSLAPANVANQVSQLFVNPAEPSKLYGVGSGSLFGSTDGGMSWKILFSGSVASGNVVAFSPAPSGAEMLYLATGSRGELKSSDGGATWKSLAGSPPAQFLAVDPGDGMTVYAAPSSGLISRTTDGGATWAPWSDGIPSGETWTALTAVPTVPREILAAGSDGLYELTGTSGFWMANHTGLAFDSADLVAVSSGANPTLYAGLTIYSGPGPSGIPGVDVDVRPPSSASWNTTTIGFPSLYARSDTSVAAITTDPVDPNQAWVSVVSTTWPSGVSGQLWRTNDAGADWSTIGPSDESLPFASLALRAGSPQTLFGGLTAYESELSGVVSGGGLRSSTDGGGTWRDPGAGLPTQSVVSIGLSASDSGLILVGLQVFAGGSQIPMPAIYRTSDGGETWSPTGPAFDPDTSVIAIIVDPRNSKSVIACASEINQNSTLLRSLDGGITWESSPLPAYFSGLAIDPRSSATLYAASSIGVLVSYDSGDTWYSFGTGLEGFPVNAIAIEASGNVLHAATNLGVFDLGIPSILAAPVALPGILGGRGRP